MDTHIMNTTTFDNGSSLSVLAEKALADGTYAEVAQYTNADGKVFPAKFRITKEGKSGSRYPIKGVPLTTEIAAYFSALAMAMEGAAAPAKAKAPVKKRAAKAKAKAPKVEGDLFGGFVGDKAAPKAKAKAKAKAAPKVKAKAAPKVKVIDVIAEPAVDNSAASILAAWTKTA
jgi:hypothetical protein